MGNKFIDEIRTALNPPGRFQTGLIVCLIPDLTILVHATDDPNNVTKVVVLEVDELQHRTYKLQQEVLREGYMCTALLTQYTSATTVHIIRFNPDDYKHCGDSYPRTGETKRDDLGIYTTNAATNAVPPSSEILSHSSVVILRDKDS